MTQSEFEKHLGFISGSSPADHKMLILFLTNKLTDKNCIASMLLMKDFCLKQESSASTYKDDIKVFYAAFKDLKVNLHENHNSDEDIDLTQLVKLVIKTAKYKSSINVHALEHYYVEQTKVLFASLKELTPDVKAQKKSLISMSAEPLDPEFLIESDDLP
jgi:hypothetical protein